jgi:hypothetical protein
VVVAWRPQEAGQFSRALEAAIAAAGEDPRDQERPVLEQHQVVGGQYAGGQRDGARYVGLSLVLDDATVVEFNFLEPQLAALFAQEILAKVAEVLS